MPKTISQYINHQQAPALLLRFPRLLFLYYWFNRMTVLRTWYVRQAFRKILSEGESPKNILDAGCGMGDFIFSIPDLNSTDAITGIDVSPSNIQLCRRLAETLNKQNSSFVQSNLSDATIPPDQDIILCIAVLMYVEDDIALLKKFRDALSERGKLLLYVPVNYRRHLSLYKTLSQKSGFDYDETIGRPQTYTDESIKQRLEDSGFIIEEQRYSFGTFAAVMFEVLAIFEFYFKRANPLFIVVLFPLYIIFFSFNISVMFYDYYSKRMTGNGTVIVAKKKLYST